jgi:hypothetical protein
MMMSDISVIIYSYKGKVLKNVIENLLDNASDRNRLHFKVIDQHPLKRDNIFEKELACAYTHIFWDWQNSPIGYKKTMLDATTEKYTLFISDNIFVQKDWDIQLVDFIKDSKNVVSGNNKVRLEKQGHFFIKKNYNAHAGFELTQFIDRSFVFGKTSTFNQGVVLPEYLKYNGEEECLSVELFTSGSDIFSAPYSMYNSINKNTLDELYVPFSLNHNYNAAIDLMQNGFNEFVSVAGRERTVEDFNIFHNNIFKSLSKLPFQTNDVEYDPMNLNFNSVDARRFVARTKAIH